MFSLSRIHTHAYARIFFTLTLTIYLFVFFFWINSAQSYWTPEMCHLLKPCKAYSIVQSTILLLQVSNNVSIRNLINLLSWTVCSMIFMSVAMQKWYFSVIFLMQLFMLLLETVSKTIVFLRVPIIWWRKMRSIIQFSNSSISVQNEHDIFEAKNKNKHEKRFTGAAAT